MLRVYILNTLNEPFPNKCQILNSILETCSMKDLYTTVELIIELIYSDNFSHNGNSNYTNNDYSKANTFLTSDINNNNNNHRNFDIKSSSWPLKSINQAQSGYDYNCIFNFLSTNSLFWSSIFKLESVGAVFDFNCSNLPPQLRFRIENGLSTLSSKLDAFNVLKLSALEYYLFNFFMVLNDTKTSSKRIYNDCYGNIELDSVYADLLNEYLNFFLPVNARDVSFPTFSNLLSSQPKTSASMSSNVILTQPTQRPQSLFKRVIQKSMIANDDDLGFGLGELDRIGDIKKIDLFLRLINECLIYPYTESSSSVDHHQLNEKNAYALQNNLNFNANKTSFFSRNVFGAKNNFSSPNFSNLSPSSSPLKYDPKQQLSNIETIFALSMILRHSHVFVNAYPIDHQSVRTLDANRPAENIIFSSRKSTKYGQKESPIDEFRVVLFKNYWRKSFYKYFLFHFEHWPLLPSIKWIIELWLTYIQSWKFNLRLMDNRDNDSLALLSDFIRENFLIYNDIYQLILKRYCIIDLTKHENLQLLNQILIVFLKEKDLVKKNDLVFANFQSIYFQLSRNDFLNAIRNNQEYRSIFNLFQELDKPVHLFKPLIGVENLKMMSNFYESLLNAKKMLENLLAKKMKSESNILTMIYQSLFSCESETELSSLNLDDINYLVKQIDDSLKLIQSFYKSNSPYMNDLFAKFEPVEIESSEQELMHGTIFSNKKLVESKNAEPDYELTNTGFRLKLTPKGRYQMINGLKKPALINIYDPDISPIGDNENRCLVYFFKIISDYINNKFSGELISFYNRSDFIGTISRKMLYGPEYSLNQLLKNASNSNAIIKDPLAKNLVYDFDDTTTLKENSVLCAGQYKSPVTPKISLRFMASYKFIFYFLIVLFLIKTLFSYSLPVSIMIVFSLLFFYRLYKN